MDGHEDRATGTGREVVPGVVVRGDTIRLSSGGPGERDRANRTVLELARFVGDVGRLLWRLARDPRVPWQAKAVAGGAMAYVVSPLDVIPDVVPGIGQMDDLFIIVRSLRYLAGQAGYDVLHELWPGSEEGFALLLVLAGTRS